MNQKLFLFNTFNGKKHTRKYKANEETSIEVKKIKKQDIINQIENSIIAENPSSTLEILENDLIIATPQKIIDNKISTRYKDRESSIDYIIEAIETLTKTTSI